MFLVVQCLYNISFQISSFFNILPQTLGVKNNAFKFSQKLHNSFYTQTGKYVKN